MEREGNWAPLVRSKDDGRKNVGLVGFLIWLSYDLKISLLMCMTVQITWAIQISY